MSGFLRHTQTHDFGLDDLHHVLVVEDLSEKRATTIGEGYTGTGGLHYLNLSELSVAYRAVRHINKHIVVE